MPGDEKVSEGKSAGVEEEEEDTKQKSSAESKEDDSGSGSDNNNNDEEGDDYSGGGDDNDGSGDLPEGTVKVDASRDINADPIHHDADIKACKLSNRVREQVVEIARQAIEQSSVQTSIAKYIKTQLDKELNPAWHCVVGREFGMSLSHSEDNLIYFYLGEVAFLVWQHSRE